jgi:hypothetical protein
MQTGDASLGVKIYTLPPGIAVCFCGNHLPNTLINPRIGASADLWRETRCRPLMAFGTTINSDNACNATFWPQSGITFIVAVERAAITNTWRRSASGSALRSVSVTPVTMISPAGARRTRTGGECWEILPAKPLMKPGALACTQAGSIWLLTVQEPISCDRSFSPKCKRDGTDLPGCSCRNTRARCS